MQATRVKAFYLSVQQSRLWAFQQSFAYRSQAIVRLEGRLDYSIFMNAVQSLIDRHDILRTAFYSVSEMDVPLQMIASAVQGKCPVIDMQEFSREEQYAELETCFSALQEVVLDLEADLPLQTFLLRFSCDMHFLLLLLPALCADTATMVWIAAELGELYAAFLAEGSPEEGPPLQYADVSAWQDKLLAAEDADMQRRYWRNIDLSQRSRDPFKWSELANAADRTGRREMSFAPHTLAIPLEESLSKQIQELAQRHEVSVASILLACWKTGIWRLSDETYSLIGVACDGRAYEELECALGLYTRVVPVQVVLTGDLPFLQLVKLLDTSLREANKWQAYFTWEQESDTTIPSFFPIGFEYTAWPSAFATDSLSLSLQRSLSYSEPFLVRLSVYQREECLRLELHYDAGYVGPGQARRLSSVLHTLLCSAVEEPASSLSTLPLLSQETQNNLLQVFRTPALPDAVSGWHQLFEAQVKRVPAQLAVLSPDEQMTYAELNCRANQLARLLVHYGVGPGELVGLCLQRSAQMIVALLAILKAGAAYLPLDPEMPSARLGYQLSHARASLLLGERALPLSGWRGRMVYLEDLVSEMEQFDNSNLLLECRPQDLAYVIYTSGSTGMPKGVMIQQQSIVNYTRAVSRLFHVEPGWQYATVSTLSADLGNTAIFCALASGGCLQVPDYATITSAQAFVRWTTTHPIDVLKIVPSHLSALLVGGQAVLPRKALVLGGEAVSPVLIERICNVGGECTLYNHYGPTETTIGVLVHTIGTAREWADEEHRPVGQRAVPLGRPISGMEAYVLDRSLRLVPTGVTGELYLGGIGLAVGYVDQSEQTAGRFVPHPFVMQAGARLYKTGDLARYTEDEQIEFIGRTDRQIKLRGYRIELSEIEVVLKRHPDVWDAVVVLREDRAEDPHIVGYVVTRRSQKLSADMLIAFMREALPEYMLPSAFVFLERLPLTANGKVDQHRLPAPLQQSVTPSLPALPRSPVEEMVLEIWTEFLKTSLIGIHDNFFQLGGHSLLATQLIARVQTTFQVELSILALFEAPTVAQLARRIEQLLRGGTGLPALIPLPRTQDFPLPLSFAQQRLWFLQQLEPESTAYNKAIALRLKGTLSRRALEYSFGEMLRRHEILRTSFGMREDRPEQIIHPVPRFHLPVIALSALTQDEYLKEALRLAEQEEQHHFDLARGPLLRASLLELNVQEHVLLLTMHHILSDGWSNSLFMRELQVFYHAFLTEKPAALPPLSIQYADFAYWQRQWLQGDALTKQLAYWREQLAGVSPLELPTDYPRPAVQSYRGAVHSLLLPGELKEDLMELSRREGVTLFMVLLAAFNVLLARYSNQSDICVGVPVANRTRTEMESLIGFFVNTLPLRTDLSGNPSFVELLARVRTVTLGAYAHQDTPFELMVEELQPERSLSRSPLFQVMFSVQQLSDTEGTTWEEYQSDLSVNERLDVEHVTARFDLTFLVTPQENGLFCGVEYATDLFTAATIERMLLHWQRVLSAIVARPVCKLTDIPLLTSTEYEQTVYAWNATQAVLPNRACLHSLIEEQSNSTPDAVALLYGEQHLTYGQLNHLADRLAWYLQTRKVGPETVVGMCLPRSPLAVIVMLSILKSGGIYLPLDPAVPAERLRFLLSEAQPVLVVATEHLAAFSGEQVALLTSEKIWSVLAGLHSKRPSNVVQPQNCAYIIYTSGSTGTPKGVMVTHHNGVSSTLARHSYYAGKVESYLLLSPLSFDSSLAGLFWTLSQGGRLVLPEAQMYAEPAELAELIERVGISHLLCIPSFYALLLRMAQPIQLAAMRTIVVAGEACPLALVEQHRESLPTVAFYNEYGPTEGTVWSSVYRDRGLLEGISLPIGRPIANVQLYLLDSNLQPVPVGVAGELYIGGHGVARGYIRRADLTAERFLPHPFSQEAGARLYRSGDRARYHADGTLEYLGRNDQQVKIRGYRIEPGEIEATLSRHPQVRAVVILAREDSEGERYLVAYIVPDCSQRQETTELTALLRTYLKERLPEYMVPAFYVMLEQMPLTVNGKVDWKALPVPQKSQSGDDEQVAVQRNTLEELLMTIWCELLGLKQCSVYENFFDLGGHSLSATQLVARIRTLLRVEMPLRVLFEFPTVAGLAAWVTRALQERSAREKPELVPMTRTQNLPLSFPQQRLWFISQLEPDSPAYVIPLQVRVQGSLELAALYRAINTVVERHESLRTVFQVQEDRPVQIIKDTVNVAFPLIDLEQLSSEERETEAHRHAQQEKMLPFDLAQGPLLRTVLVRFSRNEHVLLLAAHHIIADGWSMDVLIGELSRLYRDFSANEPPSLPELHIQYADFAVWQRQWLQGEVLEAQLAYWMRQLGGYTPLRLPTDYPRPPMMSKRSDDYAFALASDLSEALVKLSRREGVTLFMLLLAAFQTLLYRYTGQTDIIVGTDVANRTEVALEKLIGFFINLLALRNDLSGAPSFLEVLGHTRAMVLDAYAHQETPFEMIVERLQPQHAIDQVPLIQALLVLQNQPLSTVRFSDLILTPFMSAETTPVKFDLALFMIEDAHQLKGVVKYSHDLFSTESIMTMMGRFEALLRSIVERPETPIDLLDFYTEHEKMQQAEKGRKSLHKLRFLGASGTPHAQS